MQGPGIPTVLEVGMNHMLRPNRGRDRYEYFSYLVAALVSVIHLILSYFLFRPMSDEMNRELYFLILVFVVI